MKTSQRKTGCRVIEYRSSPGGGRMAERAVGRECGGNMIRHHPAQRSSALVCRCMTIDAGCGSERVVVVDVARNAGRWRRGNVHPGQGKPR